MRDKNYNLFSLFLCEKRRKNMIKIYKAECGVNTIKTELEKKLLEKVAKNIMNLKENY